MQTINEEANSDARPDVDGAVEQPDRRFSGESLDKIIEAGRLLTIDERATLRRVLGKFCSKRIKKLIREKLTAPTIPWGNPDAYKQVFFFR